MIIFIHGEDTFRSRRKLNEIIESYRNQASGFSLRFLDGLEAEFNDFRNEIDITSMFQEKKLVILTNVFSNSELSSRIFDFLKDKKDIEDTVLFYESVVDKKNSLFKFLVKKENYEFELLKNQNLRKWVQKEFDSYDVKINLRALESIVSSLGNDLWNLSNEIRKLALYKKGSEITSEDVSLMIRPKMDPVVFDTIDAMAERDKKRAINLLHQHLDKGDSPFYLFSMVKFQISNLLAVKDLAERNKSFAEILSKTRLHPFVARKSYRLSQKFDLEQLKNLYRKIFKLEIKIKTGKIDPDLALDMLIAEI